MNNETGIVQLLKKETGSVDKGTSRNRCCACGFWQSIWNGNSHSEGVGLGSGADGSRTKSTVGKGSGGRRRTEESRWQGSKASDVGSRT